MHKRQYIFDISCSTASKHHNNDQRIKKFGQAIEKQNQDIEELIREPQKDKKISYKYADIQESKCYMKNSSSSVYVTQESIIKQPKMYCPLSKIREENQNIIKNNNIQKALDYLKSEDYRHYIEKAWKGAKQQSDLVSQMRNMRNNNIYLQKYGKGEEQKWTLKKNNGKEREWQRNKQEFDDGTYDKKIYESNQMTYSLQNLSKISQKQYYYPNTVGQKCHAALLSCEAYLQESSMENPIQDQPKLPAKNVYGQVTIKSKFDDKESEQKRFESNYIKKYSYIPYRNPLHAIEDNKPKPKRNEQQIVKKNYQQLEPTHRKSPVFVKSKSQISLQKQSKTVVVKNAFEINKKQKQYMIYEELDYYKKSNLKENKVDKIERKGKGILTTNTAEINMDRIRLKNSTNNNIKIQQQSQILEPETSDKYISTATSNIYSIDFKLQKPKANHFIPKMPEKAINKKQNKVWRKDSQQRSLSISKSNSKIKMSLVTISGKTKRDY